MTAKFRWAALAFALFVSAPARADWEEASSDHFVVYADAGEAQLRRFATNLESYHAALALVTGQTNVVPSPSNRVTVYVVGSVDKVRKLFGDKEAGRYLQGFYVPRAGGTLAIVPDISTAANTDGDFTLQVLLHEYAHHFLISGSSFPIPRWANEGGAEFFSSAGFEKDGGMTIGRPNATRLIEMQNYEPVPAVQLVDPAAYKAGKGKGKGYDSFYGRSWLLYHYLTLGGPRKGQLTAYYQALIKGQSSPAAAKAVFGDLGALDKELKAYAARPKFTTVVIKAKALPTGPVLLRKLGEGEAAAMPLLIRQKRGIQSDQAPALAAEARALAARYPQDAAVLTVLAEAEHDAEQDAAAVAAADRALAIDPKRANAWVQKGLAQFRIAELSGDAKDLKVARNTFVDLNRLENDHPLPLVYYFRSFAVLGKPPSPLAVQGLERAAALAPYDLGLRMTAAMQQVREGRFDDARYNLAPVAYGPHSDGMGGRARAILAKLDADPAWRGQGPLPDAENTDDGDSE